MLPVGEARHDSLFEVAEDRGEILAVEPETGSFKWRVNVGGYVRGALSVARSGAVLAGTYGPTPRVLSLDPRDGAVRFAFAAPT